MPSPNRYTVSTPISCLGRWLTSGREARRIAALWADRSPETVILTTVTPKGTTLEIVKRLTVAQPAPLSVEDYAYAASVEAEVHAGR